jgi:hypothetical protein
MEIVQFSANVAVYLMPKNIHIFPLFLLIGCLLCFSQSGVSQSLFQTPDTLSKPRQVANIVGQGLTRSGTLGGLYVAWYSQYDQESFHFFDDSKEWLQMDKVGHSATAYQISPNL